MSEDEANVRERRAELKLKIRRRGIYLLPNMFTLANLFFGFYAILQAVNLNFDAACISIFVAMVLDSLDGRIARMTNTQSAFGAELDSLSDMVSFGLAPAVLLYEFALNEIAYRDVGIVSAFVYSACAALRLARFNVQINVVDKRFFMGLPSPGAAALLTAFVWVCSEWDLDGSAMKWWALAITLFGGLSMVTTARFYSFKTINLKRSVPFSALVGLLGVYAVFNMNRPTVLFFIFLGYSFSGYIYSALNFQEFYGKDAKANRAARLEAAKHADDSKPH